MDIKSITRSDSQTKVVIQYLNTKRVQPTSFKPGRTFDIEIAFQPISDYRSNITLTCCAILFVLAAVFLWYYRDVWRYVAKSVG